MYLSVINCTLYISGTKNPFYAVLIIRSKGSIGFQTELNISERTSLVSSIVGKD